MNVIVEILKKVRPIRHVFRSKSLRDIRSRHRRCLESPTPGSKTKGAELPDVVDVYQGWLSTLSIDIWFTLVTTI